MERFHMVDIIPMLGLPIPPAGKSSYNIPCPCCDDKPKGKHLNINLRKDGVPVPPVRVCRRRSGPVCPLRENPRENALKELLSRRGIAGASRRPALPEVEENPLTGREERHATYTALLSHLSLASDHRENLLSRGFSRKRSAGWDTGPPRWWAAPCLPASCGRRAATWPGFRAFSKRRESGPCVSPGRGILIPVRDMAGHIQGLQVRLTTRRSGSSAGFPVRAFQRAAARKPGSTWPESPGRWSC